MRRSAPSADVPRERDTRRARAALAYALAGALASCDAASEEIQSWSRTRRVEASVRQAAETAPSFADVKDALRASRGTDGWREAPRGLQDDLATALRAGPDSPLLQLAGEDETSEFRAWWRTTARRGDMARLGIHWCRIELGTATFQVSVPPQEEDRAAFSAKFREGRWRFTTFARANRTSTDPRSPREGDDR